jgi:hypothetical protein
METYAWRSSISASSEQSFVRWYHHNKIDLQKNSSELKAANTQNTTDCVRPKADRVKQAVKSRLEICRDRIKHVLYTYNTTKTQISFPFLFLRPERISRALFLFVSFTFEIENRDQVVIHGTRKRFGN